MKRIILLLCCALLLLLCNHPTARAEETERRPLLRGIAGAAILNSMGFTDEEKDLIRQYYRDRRSSSEADEDASDSDDNEQEKSHASGKKKEKKAKKAKGDKGLPPGLAKKEELPPGLQKQLERNGTLPPGLAKRDLPDDLQARLPPRTEDQDRIIVAEDIVLIERVTGRILDILRGGARPAN